MLALLAEDKSDVAALLIIIRNLMGDRSRPIFSKGFSGCGELCRKAASHIEQFRRRGAKRFIICHDADRNDPVDVRHKVEAEVIQKLGEKPDACVVVPVQELEAWILADADAITKVIPSLDIKAHNQPELIRDPKEHLINASRVKNCKPLYNYTFHNARVAEHLNLNLVAKRCPSFVVLRDFVLKRG